MRRKYAKLLSNLNNARKALCESEGETKDISKMMRQEALRCYETAGIECATRDEVVGRRGDGIQTGPIPF
jgi:hypothetical protein